MISLVDRILSAKQQPPSSPFIKLLRGNFQGDPLLRWGNMEIADTSPLERQINEMVYELYGLTSDEIAIVQGRG